MPRRAPVRGYGGPSWRQYARKRPTEENAEKKELSERKQTFEEKKWLTEQMNRAALGGDYYAAEVFGKAADWPIERKYISPPPGMPEEKTGIIAGPGNESMYISPGGEGEGARVAPAMKDDPVATFKGIQQAFMAEKGYPTETIPGKMEDLAIQKPGGGYKQVLEKPPEKFGKGEWPKTYWSPQGEWRVATNEAEARDAIKSGYGPDKPDKPEKEPAYEKRILYNSFLNKQWEVRSSAEELQARSLGYVPQMPANIPKSAHSVTADEARKARRDEIQDGLKTVLGLYKGVDTILTNMVKSAGEAKDMNELLDVAKNAYERLKVRAKDKTDQRAIRDLKAVEAWVDEMVQLVGTQKGTPALGEQEVKKPRTADDYITGALKSGTQVE